MSQNDETANARSENKINASDEPFGDNKAANINDTTIRITGINVNTMPRLEKDRRMRAFKQWARTSKANIIACTENNWNYDYVNPDERPDSIMKGWWNNSSITTTWMKTNVGDDRERSKYGGVSLVSNGRIAGTISSRGWDEEKMGRWTWHTYRGKDNFKTTCICLYFPIKNTDRENSVYMQQAIYLDKKYPGEQREPHKQYTRDLRALIENKLAEGHNIIITGDFNQNIQQWNEPLVQLLRQLGLREIIEEKHGGKQLPATFNNGQHAIDGIWATKGINAVAAGYDEWTNGFSNHRSYWVDIPIDEIIGSKGEAIVRPKGRRLQTQIPKIRNKFNKIANKEIRKRKLHTRLLRLREQIIESGKATPEQLNKLAKMHKEQRMCIATAERNCTKIRSGEVSFSLTTNLAMGKIVCLELLVRREARKGKKNRPHGTYVRRTLRRWKCDIDHRGKSLDWLKMELSNARAEYDKIKPNSKTLRDDFFSELAIDRSKEDGVKAASHLKQIINIENNRRMFSRVRNATKKTSKGAASYIEEVQDDGTRKKITDKKEMEARITEANQKKLQQANNLDIRKEPLRSYFGEQGDTEKWEKIYRGELKLPEDYPAEKGLKLFFEAIAKNHLPPIELIPDDIKELDKFYNESWKKMKERTSCGPPTHFGHYRAPNVGSPLSIVNSIIGTLPLITGEVPELWKECVNTMLVKKINDMLPEKLRLVTLMEPQYLHCSKLINKMMMINAEKYYKLAPEQYGSRKGKNSRTHCLHKRLLFDLVRIEHSTLVLIANDLKSCYDRIVMMIAYIILRHYGISKEAAKMVTTNMMEMKHRIRTVYGDSDEYYGGDKWKDGIKPHGNGQGNGDGPGLWDGISSECLNSLREEGYGVEMSASISRICIALVAFSFVDDTDQIQQGKTVEEAMQKAQEGIVLWDELLRATGGAIEPGKSDWVLVNYEWKQQQWKLTARDENHTLEVRDPYDKVKPLQQLKPTDARETLGVWQSPTGKEDTQVEKLVEAINTWCSGMQSRFLPSQDVEMAIKCTIGRKIHYCLVATNFTKKQCKAIIDPIIRRVMPKMKLSRTTSRVLIHAPTSLLGIGIDDPYIGQLVEHVKNLCDKGGTTTHTGIILANVIEAHLIESGLSGQMTEWKIEPFLLSLFTDSWIKSTITEMSNNNIQMKSDHAELSMWRKNDLFLMDEAIKRTRGAGAINYAQLHAINKCRKFLQACTLSDLCNGNGTEILTTAYECTRRTPNTSSSAYKWPMKYAKPNQTDIDYWKAYLNTFTTRRRKLRKNLGNWKSEASKWHDWRYHPGYERLYKRETSNQWTVWTIYGNRSGNRKRQFQQTNLIPETSEIQGANTIPHVTMQRSGRVKCDGFRPIEAKQSNGMTLLQTFKSHGWAIADITILDIEQIITDIVNHNGNIIADGSHRSLKSTSAFIIFHQEEDLLKGGNYVPGPGDDQSGYRGELAGILGGMIVVNDICDHHNITEGTVTIACDNDKALDAAFDTEAEVPCTRSCFDIIRMIHYQMRRSNIKWKKQRVQGHQDKKKKYEDLDMWGKANVRADKLAKQYMTQHPTTITNVNPPGSGWMIYINDQPIVANTSRQLYDQCTSASIKEFWAKKNDIDMDYYDVETLNDVIYWKGIQKMTKLIPGYKRRWISKHMAHISATGKVMGPNRRKERSSDKCPMCDAVEDSNHVYLCPHDRTEEEFQEKLVIVEEWLNKHSPWDVRDAIIEILQAVRANRDVQHNNNWGHDVHEVVDAQLHLSERSLVHGLLHSDWIPIQEEYLNKTKSKMKVSTWAAHLIRLIWDISWGIWRKRCDYLHSTEEARRELLSNNVDDKIAELQTNMPPNIWMTAAQRKILGWTTRQISKWPTKRKIRWYKRAKIMVDAYIDHLEKTQNSASALFMRNYMTNAPPTIHHRPQRVVDDDELNAPTPTPPTQLKQTTISDWMRGNVP